MRFLSIIFTILLSLVGATLGVGLSSSQQSASAQSGETPQATVTARTADVYSAPNVDARIMLRLESRSVLRPLGRTRDGGWWLVVVNSAADVRGWVRSSSVTANTAANALPFIDVPDYSQGTPAPNPTDAPTAVANTVTPLAPTATPLPPTSTPLPPTATPLPPTPTPTPTQVPPTPTPVPPTPTPPPPTPTPTPTPTPRPVAGARTSAALAQVSGLPRIANPTLHAEPAIGSGKVGIFLKGSSFNVQGISVDGQWWRVTNPKTPSQQAWIQAGTVRANVRANAFNSRNGSLTVLKATVLRATPDAKGRLILNSPSGRIFVVLGRTQDSAWFKVRINRTLTAWIPSGSSFIPPKAQQIPVMTR